jgi:uncharacterized protein
MEYLVGFVIALLVGLTGVGAGSLTAPMLILFFKVSPAEAVGTALLFGSVTKLSVVPVFVARKQVDYRILGLLAMGGLPGVLAGTFLLRTLDINKQQNLLFLVLGATVVVTALYSLYRTTRGSNVTSHKDRAWWLPFLALPIGAEVGFSSAGAGALGSLALLLLTPLTPAVVVGTDLSFGLLLSTVGGGLHILSGNFESMMLLKLLLGGLLGAFAGANLSAIVPPKPLRILLSVWLVSVGGQLCWRALV